jgi:hypothetical protein
MSTALPPSPVHATAGPRWPRWLREPLLHFLVLGGLLFAVDHFVAARSDDPNTIVMTTEIDEEAGKVFEDARGRAPDERELTALQQVWLDNEVLYREGLALGLDKGDPAIRDRVIFKALSVIESGLKPPAADEKILKDWFAAHRAKYDEPARFDFQEAVLAGDSTEGAVRDFVKELNAGVPGDAKAGLRVFKGRPAANLEQGYGPEFAKALEASPLGTWQALATKNGWRAVRLDAKAPGQPATFEAFRNVVQQDWTDAAMAEQRTAAVRALAKKYKIKHEIIVLE